MKLPETLERLSRILSDRYRIERELGRGGMATVFLAEDLKHHRPVAIKVLSPEVAAATGSERFLREIQIAARLTHPHILALHDSGAADTLLYYVMPYVAGESLRTRLERERQLSLEDALRLAREVASALGYAHAQGVVHRDIKPENILLAEGIALVADFGVARAVGTFAAAGMTQAGVTLGTPVYMSPEQSLGSGELDGRADLYSLGCVVFEMLAGEPPFTGASLQALQSRHAFEPPPPLRTRRPGIPEAVERAVFKALAKVPADRHATAARFAEALSVAIGGFTTPLPPSSDLVIAHNLPKPRTSFVGRERELAECARLLGETQLLTLTGVGGCGKTRLALRVAENLLENYPDGAWFVDFAPLADPGRVAMSVAGAMGLAEQSGQPVLETLARHVAERRLLLLLDNCEHLVSSVADLADRLLKAGPQIQILATSREGLGIAGERLFAARSFLLPPADHPHDPGILASFESVKLFVERARSVDSEFTLTAENAGAVTEICRRLDGIPLAIELAAVRVKVLSTDQIRTRLDDRFRLLTGGQKALPRHQTLRATFQWSHDQLTEREKELFRRLSVFAGGWSLDGAAAVAGEHSDEFDVLDLLGRLVDKSLVVVERVRGDEPRYRMLETVRQYAQERLDESGEGVNVRNRHLAYSIALAEFAEPKLFGPEQAAWLDRMDAERENLVSALAWCELAEAGREAGLRIAGATRLYWTYRGLLELGLRLTQQTIHRAEGAEPTLALARALLSEGQLALIHGKPDQAQGALEACVAVSRAAGDSLCAAKALGLLGSVYGARKDSVRALECAHESLSIARGAGDRRVLSFALMSVCELLRIEGDFGSARPLLEESVALFRNLGDFNNLVAGLGNLIGMEIHESNWEKARATLREGIAVVSRLGTGRASQLMLECAAALLAARDDATQAARLYGASVAAATRMGIRREPHDERFISSQIARSRQALGPESFADAYGRGQQLSLEVALAEVSEWLEPIPDPVPGRAPN